MIQHLKSQNIHTLIHYPVPPHLTGAFANLGVKEQTFPVAETIAKTTLSLPLWPYMQTSHIKEVTKHLLIGINN